MECRGLDFYTTAWSLWPCKGLCEHNWSCSDHHFDRHGYLLFTYRKKKWPFSGIFIRKSNSIHKTFLLGFKLPIGLVIVGGLVKFLTNYNISRQIRLFVFAGVLLHASTFHRVPGAADHPCTRILEVVTYSWVNLHC